ncbi:hypothetical protein Tco_0722159, partial [Tanacetum coccineum]
ILDHKDTPISEESIERRETPSVDVQILRIGGNVNTRLSTGGHDMVPTTTGVLKALASLFHTHISLVKV